MLVAFSEEVISFGVTALGEQQWKPSDLAQNAGPGRRQLADETPVAILARMLPRAGLVPPYVVDFVQCGRAFLGRFGTASWTLTSYFVTL